METLHGIPTQQETAILVQTKMELTMEKIGATGNVNGMRQQVNAGNQV